MRRRQIRPGIISGRVDLPAGVTVVIERDAVDRSRPEALSYPVNMAKFRARVPGTLEYLTQVSRRADADRVVAMLATYRERLAENADADGASSDYDEGSAGSIRLDITVATLQSEWVVAHTLKTAERAEQDLPVTWGRFTDGRIPWRNLDIAVQQAAGLHPDALPAYDAAAAERCEAELPGDVKKHLAADRERLQAGTAIERTKLASARRHVAIEPLPDGQAALSLVGPAFELAAIDDALAKVAFHAVGSDEAASVPAAMYDAAVEILIGGLRAGNPDAESDTDLDTSADLETDTNASADADTAAEGDATASVDDTVGAGAVAGGAAGIPADRLAEFGRVRVPHRVGVEPQILLTIPQSVATGTEDVAGGTAVLAGYGPIDPATARGIAGWAKSWTRVLTDPITGGLVDIDPTSRRIPVGLQRWLRARDEQCRAPGCNRVNCDLDHTNPFGEGGPTSPENLAFLCRPSHRIKHGGYWRNELHPDGRLDWESIWGTRYTTYPATAVAPARTTRITAPRPLDADNLD